LPDFDCFVYHPNMLFGSSSMWWGKCVKRPVPHEGIDMRWYATTLGDNIIRSMPTGLIIPCIADGEVTDIFADIMDHTVIVRHRNYIAEGLVLHTVYGHVRPASGLAKGSTLSFGTPIGSIEASRTTAPPHLHLSAAWMKDEEMVHSVIANYDALNSMPLLGCPAAISVAQVWEDAKPDDKDAGPPNPMPRSVQNDTRMHPTSWAFSVQSCLGGGCFPRHNELPARKLHECTHFRFRQALGLKSLLEGFGKVDKDDEALEIMFHDIDVDKSGSISYDEMRDAIVHTFGEQGFDQAKMLEMLKAADADGDGEVDLDEFKAFVRAIPEVDPDKGLKVVIKGFGKIDTSDEALESLFKRIDVDGNETLSSEEMSNALRKLHGDAVLEQGLVKKLLDMMVDHEFRLDEFKLYMRAIPIKKQT